MYVLLTLHRNPTNGDPGLVGQADVYLFLNAVDGGALGLHTGKMRVPVTNRPTIWVLWHETTPYWFGEFDYQEADDGRCTDVNVDITVTFTPTSSARFGAPPRSRLPAPNAPQLGSGS